MELFRSQEPRRGTWGHFQSISSAFVIRAWQPSIRAQKTDQRRLDPLLLGLGFTDSAIVELGQSNFQAHAHGNADQQHDDRHFGEGEAPFLGAVYGTLTCIRSS